MSDILVVDDSSTIHSIIKATLGKNHHIRCAFDIHSAEELLRGQPPDLVLLDVTMPEGSGLRFCERIKSGEHRHIPVILVTGQRQIGDIASGFAAGANDYLPKPFARRELEVRVEAQLRMVSLQQERVQLERMKTFKAMVATYHDQINNQLAILSGAFKHLSCTDEKYLSMGEGAMEKIGEILGKISSLKALEFEPYLDDSKQLLIKD